MIFKCLPMGVGKVWFDPSIYEVTERLRKEREEYAHNEPKLKELYSEVQNDRAFLRLPRESYEAFRKKILKEYYVPREEV